VPAYVATWRQPGGDDRGGIQVIPVIWRRTGSQQGEPGVGARHPADRRARLRDERQSTRPVLSTVR